MTASKGEETDEARIRRLVREEFRRVGLRPPMPTEYGTYRWNVETDAWDPVPEP